MRGTVLMVLALGGLALFPAAATAAETRAAYVTQADPLCADANRDINRLNKRYRALHDRGRHHAAAQTLKKTGDRLHRSIDQVSRITPPPGDAALVDRWLSVVRKVARNNVRMGRAHGRGDLEAEERLARANDRIRAKAHAMVRGFGFRHCA